MKKIDLTEWDNNLQPYRKFYEAYKAGEWTTTARYEIPLALNKRIILSVDRPTESQAMMLDVGRHDSLADKGIYSSDVDSKELAEELFNSLFNYLSIHEMEAVIEKLQEYISSVRDRRT